MKKRRGCVFLWSAFAELDLRTRKLCLGHHDIQKYRHQSDTNHNPKTVPSYSEITSRPSVAFKCYVIASMTFIWTAYTLTIKSSKTDVPQDMVSFQKLKYSLEPIEAPVFIRKTVKIVVKQPRIYNVSVRCTLQLLSCYVLNF